MPYILLVILWITWCTLHSALISLTVTNMFQKKFPNTFHFYRIVYNLLAVASLLPILLYASSLKGEPIIAWSGAWRIVPLLLGLTALFFFVAGARRYDLPQFLGLRQIKKSHTCSVLTDDCSLDTKGILSMVRHPWYSGGLFIVWARPMDLAAILTNVVICAYFVVGTILEERKLKMLFGQQYADYQQQVSMFLPLKWACRLFRQSRG